ncbi:SUMF1/EgtB/PvdO family nonheme iron enzyme [Sediminicoccus sp. KRV36]|uniref:formylglycine-generating enzyme family protein n=1 Tax=Sediminicoccus sp. KRV36 TaxID=3133721 RepID=UPI00200ECBB9|nr:SUMF1/EgtB/PvdO family nonheme iron enzyme [Sediminicoccus rosea]UPY38935.1 formylglycine-generating enzyme family protein [Sediminicoccus rosea]
MPRWLPLAPLLCALALPAQAQMPEITWPDAAWNPRPAAGDLLLPLPCGGGIAFRRVDTPAAASALADRAASLGNPDPQTDYSEFLRQAYLVGPFQDAGRPGSQHYFIAKYEVTADQFTAVMAETCPELPSGPAGRVPRAQVSWQEALGFTLRASAWLAQHARARLPEPEARAIPFLRLPTEDEWEFSARGGSAVPDADFTGRLYPMEGGLARHAWFQGQRSANGRAQAIGRLEPNPLGLHDMLGNVAEWALGPYRLNRVGRPHGLAGGNVARGGDFRTPEAALRSAMRVEYAPLNPTSFEPLRLDNVGLRPVLTRVAIADDNAPAALRSAFSEETRQSETMADDPARLIQALRGDMPEGPLRSGLTRIEATLQSDRRARTDQESLAIRAQMEAAGHIARQIMAAEARRAINSAQVERLTNVARNQGVIAAEQSRLASATQGALQSRLTAQERDMRTLRSDLESAAAALTAAIGQAPAQMRDLADGYIRIIRALGSAFPAPRLAEEAGLVTRENAQRPQPLWLPEAQAIALRHVNAAAAGRAPDRDRVVEELQAEANRLMNASVPSRPR